jgi:hypothetical protein
MNLKLEFEMTFEEFKEAQRAHIQNALKRSGRPRSRYWILFLVLFVILFAMLQSKMVSAPAQEQPNDQTSNSLASLFRPLLPYLGFFVIIVVAGFVLLRFWTKQNWFEERLVKGPLILEISHDGFRHTSRMAQLDVVWPAFIWWLETPNLFVLYATRNGIEIIPKRAFPNPTDVEALRSFLSSKIERGNR